MTATFAARNKDDIALAGVRVLVFQEKELVNSVVLQCRYLHNKTDRSSEALLDYEVFLPSYLGFVTQLIGVTKERKLREPCLRLREETAGPFGPCP